MQEFLCRVGHLVIVLAPVLALLALGYGLGRSGVIDAGLRRGLGRLVFLVLLPALLLRKLGGGEMALELEPVAMLAGWGLLLVGFAALYMATLRMSPERQGSAVTAGLRFNGALVGLPVVVQLGASELFAGGALAERYLLYMATQIPVIHVLAVLGVMLPQRERRHGGPGVVFGSLARNPILISTIAGTAIALLWPGLFGGGMVGRSLDLLGAGAIPLALLATGAAIELRGVCADLRALGGVVAARLLLFPLAALGLAVALGFDPVMTAAMVVLFGCPTAVGAVPITTSLGGEERLIAAAVAVSSLLAPVSLALILALQLA
ncbi:MAG: AEC family transporter [Planctomycetota bacterium]